MKSEQKRLVLFTSIHFTLTFLISLSSTLLQLYYSRKGIFMPTGLVGIFLSLYNLLILPVGLFFQSIKSEYLVPLQLPLWALVINSLIWGLVLSCLIKAIVVIYDKESGSKENTQTNIKNYPQKNNITTNIIGIFVIHFLISLALFFYELAFQIDNSVNKIVSYFGNISRFPAIPFHTSEELWQQPSIDFINRLTLLLANSLTCTILSIFLIIAFRNIKTDKERFK